MLKSWFKSQGEVTFAVVKSIVALSEIVSERSPWEPLPEPLYVTVPVQL